MPTKPGPGFGTPVKIELPTRSGPDPDIRDIDNTSSIKSDAS